MAAFETSFNNEQCKKLKIKFKNALESSEFCFICMDLYNLLSIDTKNYFRYMEVTESLTVREVVHSLLKDETKIYSNSICTNCKGKLFEIYSFLTSTRRQWCIMDDYIQQYESEIVKIETTVKNSNKHIFILQDPCIEKIKVKTTPIKIKNLFKCHNCNISYSSLKSLTKHINTIHSNKNTNEEILCPNCTENCIHKEYLEAYKYRQSNKIIQCVNCDYKCHNKHQLILHANRDHLNLVESTCEICAVPFYTKKCRENHITKYHKDSLKCSSCNGKFKSEVTLIKHLRAGNCLDKPYKCCECTSTFECEVKLENHRNRYHKGLFVCDICKMTLNNRVSLELHLEKHSGAIAKPNLKCYLCSIEFTSMRQYRLHNVENHGKHEKPSCKQCNKTFENYLKYNNHMKRAHFGRKYNCGLCEYVGKTNSMLDAHINRYHLKIAPYQCDVCQKRFTGDVLLLNHKKTHLATETRGYQCTECKKHFCSNSSLKKHMRLHFGKDNDPITCEICAEKFLCTSQLEDHKSLKHGGKNIPCPICGNVFNSILRVRTHVKRVHWKSSEPFDVRKLNGLKPEHYELFRDKRNLVIENCYESFS